MKICITPLKLKTSQQIPVSFTQEMSAVPARYGDFRLTAAVHVEGDIRLQDHLHFVAELHYSTQLEQVCGRCGKIFSSPLSGSFTVSFMAEPKEDAAGEIACYPVEKELVDLAEPLLDEISFQLPMQPLCREDCQGLCPICGVDRNNNSCSCVSEQIDPRWEKLKQFRIED